MMYRCCECGNLFEEGEQATLESFLGECHGRQIFERTHVCPLCHSDYDEAYQCKECGCWYTEDELFSGLCENCVNEYKNDITTCYEIGAKSLERIEINSFLAEIFSKHEIEEILFRELKESDKIKPVDCSNYINADKEWFAEMLTKEVK